MKPRPTAWIAVIAFAAVTVAAGCGSSNNNSTTSGSRITRRRTSTSLRTRRSPPRSRRRSPRRDELTVAADATYPPNEFIATDGNTIIGMDADLAKAIGQVMGLTAKVSERHLRQHHPRLGRRASTTWDVIVHGHQGAREDGRLRHLPDRTARSSTRTRTDRRSPPWTSSAATRWRRRKAPPRPTTSTAQIKKCTDAGKPGVTVQVFPDQNGVNLALSSGRADVAMADSPVVKYLVDQSDGKFKTVRLALRDRAVRDRDSQGQRHDAARARRRQGADGRRHLQEDPGLLGSDGLDQQPAGSTQGSSTSEMMCRWPLLPARQRHEATGTA